MHISEGVLSAPVLAVGAVLAVGGLVWGLRRLPWDHMMSAGLVSSAFFVASLIHIPLGPGSVHLVLNGLAGALLGWGAFPAITVALLLQALLFHYGGLTCLGVNVCIMAFPAVICGTAVRPFLERDRAGRVAAFLCGLGSVLFSAILCAAALALSGDLFLVTAWTIAIAHVPVMLVEGIITLLVVDFVRRSAPEILTTRKK